MGEIENRIEQDEVSKLVDAAPLGRSPSTMSSTELTEYAGAQYAAFNLLEGRIDALDSLGTGMLATLLDADLIVALGIASEIGRSSRHITSTELTDFAGALYAGYESLAARVGVLEGGPAGTEMEGRLETDDKNKLTDAAPVGRSQSKMSSKELTEWSGATDAAYAALDIRVAALESAT